MTRYGFGARFSIRDAAVPGRVGAHQARPARRRRRHFQFERLEERLVMAGDAGIVPTSAIPDHIQLWANSGDNILQVLDNDSGDSLRIIDINDLGFGGDLRISDDGKSLIYTAEAPQFQSPRFNYTIRGADGRCISTDVFLDVKQRIEVRRDSFEVDLNSAENRLNVFANDRVNDPTANPTIVSVNQPNVGGVLTIAEDGKSLLFTAEPGFLGSTTATYRVRTGPGEDDVVESSVNIYVVRPFLAIDDWFVVDPANPSISLDPLANESNQTSLRSVRGQSRDLRIVSVTPDSQGGQITIAEDGKSLTYVPAEGAAGVERFTYEIEDQFGNRDEATAFVHVSGQSAPLGKLHPEELRVRMLEIAAKQWGGIFGHSVAQAGGLLYPVAWNYLYADVDARFVTTNDGVVSNTNVQVAGVDEADLFETDGRYLYTFSQGRLAIIDVQDPTALRLVSVTQLSTTMDLSATATTMFLDNGRLTIIGRTTGAKAGTYVERTTLTVFDVEDPAAIRQVQRTEVDGRLIASRSIDGRVYLVVDERFTVLAIDTIDVTQPDGTNSKRYETWEEYSERVQSAALGEILPQYKSYDAAGNVVSSGALAGVNEIGGAPFSAEDRFISVVAFDTHSDVPGPAASETWCDGSIARDSIYVSHDNLYIWTTESNWATGGDKTFVRKLSISDPAKIDLVATGVIEGRPVDQFSFDEHNGLLRVVTTTPTRVRGRLTAEVSDLYVLEQEDAELKIIGQVADFAAGESVRSVRFDGDRALVVTFPDPLFDPNAVPLRDPLFVFDLSDPTAPTIEGELEVPGFSTYLELIAADRLLGFGADIHPNSGERRGVLLSLFRTDGFEQPITLDQFRFEVSEFESSAALDDHRAIAYYPEQGIVTVPITWGERLDGSAWGWQQHAELWVLRVNRESDKFELLERISHDTPALRTVRVGETLLTISGDTVSAHLLSDPTHESDRLYFGDLVIDDTFRQTEDTGPWSLDVLANDRLNEAGEKGTIVEVTQPWESTYFHFADGVATNGASSVGTVSVADDGKSLLFTPAENFYGVVTFTYTVFDEVRGRHTATVTLNVEGVIDAPEANDDTFDVEIGAQEVTLNVLGNDVDVDIPRYGYIYNWMCDVGYISQAIPLRGLEVLQLTDNADIDTSLGIVSSNLVTSDSIGWSNYYYADQRRITAVGPTDQGGTVSIDATGRLLNYTPAVGFEGTETFTYTITTGNGLTSTATVTVHVGPAALVGPTNPEPANLPDVTQASPVETPLAPIEIYTSPAETELAPLSELAPTEWTATSVSAAEVALPMAEFVPISVARSVAAQQIRQVAFAETAAVEAMNPSDLLNLALRSGNEDIEVSADEAFADLVAGAGGGDGDVDLSPSLALAWVSCSADL